MRRTLFLVLLLLVLIGSTAVATYAANVYRTGGLAPAGDRAIVTTTEWGSAAPVGVEATASSGEDSATAGNMEFEFHECHGGGGESAATDASAGY